MQALIENLAQFKNEELEFSDEKRDVNVVMRKIQSVIDSNYLYRDEEPSPKIEYSVGDKIEIIDTNGIKDGNKYWDNGDIVEIVGFDPTSYAVSSNKGHRGSMWHIIWRSEMHCVRKVENDNE